MSKITQLAEDTAPTSDDLMETVNDAAGTPVSKKIKIENLSKALLPQVNAQTGTSYTLLASDNGGIVTLSNAAAITITVPSGLGARFSCLLIQLGAGQVSLSASGTTVNNRQSHLKIAGQYGMATLVAYVANTFAFGGDTAA